MSFIELSVYYWWTLLGSSVHSKKLSGLSENSSFRPESFMASKSLMTTVSICPSFKLMKKQTRTFRLHSTTNLGWTESWFGEEGKKVQHGCSSGWDKMFARELEYQLAYNRTEPTSSLILYRTGNILHFAVEMVKTNILYVVFTTKEKWKHMVWGKRGD